MIGDFAQVGIGIAVFFWNCIVMHLLTLLVLVICLVVLRSSAKVVVVELDGIIFFLNDVCVVKTVSFHVFASAAAGQ